MNKIDISAPGSLQTKVFKEIEGAILGGELVPGQAITEQKMSEALGVSRTPVREALRQLESEGLVTGVPNKGFFVSGLSEKDIDDIYTIRIRIEGLAARWAAKNINDDQLKELLDTVELQEFYASKNDYLQMRQLDSTFHEIIYTASGSRPLKNILTQFHNYIQKPREISIKYSGRAVESIKEHRQIYDAISSRDGDKAEEYISNHILKAKENLLNMLSDNQ